MSKKNRKRAPKPVLTPKARAYQKHIMDGILHSPWFWSSIVFGLIFFIIFLAATVEAGIRYQSFVDTGNNFAAAWHHAVLDNQIIFNVKNTIHGGNLTYWFDINWFKANGYTAVVKGSAVDVFKGATATGTPIAILDYLAVRSFSYHIGSWTNQATFYETTTFFTPFWNRPIVVADNNIWDWLSQPLFGKYPYQVQSLERGHEHPNADIYRCLVYYYSFDTPDIYQNLSFFACLWPKSMNMNYGYWIIAVTFFTAFAFSFCVFCSFMMKIRKTFKSDKKDNENTLALYLEAEADNMHFHYHPEVTPVAQEGVQTSVTPTN